MGAIFVTSDLHSCYTKFMSAVPKSYSKLILLGDLFNKGREQEEMLMWALKNKNNRKIEFILGNAEVRMHNELVRYFYPDKTTMYFDYLGTTPTYSAENKNIANVVIDLVKRKKVDIDDVFDLLRNKYKWYHLEGKWILAHASWEPMKSPHSQNKVNLVYDTKHLLGAARKKTTMVSISKTYDGYNFIFGHTPIYHITKKQPNPPVILQDRFYYIDNAVFKTSRPMFFMKI